MSKHTPGPWRIEFVKDVSSGSVGSHIIRLGNEWEYLAFHKSGSTPDVEKANAHLIAAAPEMLEALENLLQFVDSIPDITNEHSKMKAARDAIKKARGES